MPEYIKHGEGTFSSLTKQQKEAVGLLSIGTFLEYFDLMLYVHMSVLLNELFFPKADPHTQAIFSALAFCLSYVLRPLGALIFGWIGDNIGRKATVVITTFMMAVSCIIMANLPTYAQIGITATYIMCICRVMQGLSSLGEIVGAQVYLTEITAPPVRYFIVGIILSIADWGGMFALIIASLVTVQGFNWQLAFWIGSGVAVVGAIARAVLRETTEFANAKRRVEKAFDDFGRDQKILNNNAMWQEKINKKTALAYFLIYCGQILKNTYSYTAAQVIHQNLLISIVGTASGILLAFMSYKIYPLKILKIKLYFSVILALICPYMLHYFNSNGVLFIQLAFASFWISEFPATPIFLKHFPVFKRFTYSSLLFALSRACMYVVIPFGVVYLVEYMSYWGLYLITIPIIIGYWLSLSYFINMEKDTGNHQ